MYKNVVIVADGDNDDSFLKIVILHIRENYKSNIGGLYSHQHKFETAEDDTIYLLSLDDMQIKYFFKNHQNVGLNIGLLPHKHASLAMKNYGISSNVNKAIDDAYNPELLSDIDIMFCNEYLTFDRISIGEMGGMSADFNSMNIFEKMYNFYRSLKNINFKFYMLEISADKKIQTAASGITVLEHSITLEKSTDSSGVLSSLHDGKLDAFILAPSSVLSYILYLVSIFISRHISIQSLPKSLGYIKSSSLKISTNEPINFILDGSLLCAKEVDVRVVKDVIKLHLGSAMSDKVELNEANQEIKDSIKLNTLPAAEISRVLVDGTLPLFKKASEEEFKDLFIGLKESSHLSYVYITLMILSTLLSTTGLFASSAPVIIGAMILAPLMAPIISLSMGVVRAERKLILPSLRTLGVGIFTALFFSSIYTLIIPLEEITSEMQSRLNPNILDLLVAIFSGMAGAYAYAKEEVAKSLAGVAIAVALVPPLSVAGIGIGLGSFEVLYGSFLLFLTNLVGITLSGALTFVVLGYAPISRGKKGIYTTAVLMVFITLPLMFSFYTMLQKNRYMKALKSVAIVMVHEKEVSLFIQNITIQKESIVVDVETISSNALSNGDFEVVKKALEAKLDKKIILEITPKILLK